MVTLFQKLVQPTNQSVKSSRQNRERERHVSSKPVKVCFKFSFFSFFLNLTTKINIDNWQTTKIINWLEILSLSFRFCFYIYLRYLWITKKKKEKKTWMSEWEWAVLSWVELLLFGPAFLSHITNCRYLYILYSFLRLYVFNFKSKKIKKKYCVDI